MTTYRDRVRETTQSTGTDDYALDGPLAGHQGFLAAFGAVSDVFYCVTDGADWEVGTGTLTSGPDTLARDTVLASSNANAPVIWGPGAKDIFHVLPAVEAEQLGTVVVSDDGGTTRTPVRCVSFEANLTLAIAGDVASVDGPSPGGGGGGALVAGYSIGVEADAVGGVTNGNPLGTWPDSSGNGYDFTEATNPPTYRGADADDGLAYVEFDDTNDVLQAIRGAGDYTGVDLTLFVVCRAEKNPADGGVACFSKSGENMASGFRPFLQTLAANGNLGLTFNGTTFQYSGDLLNSAQWTVVALRADAKLGRALALFVEGGHFSQRDQAATSFTAEAWDRVRLGAQYNNFGAAGGFARCDVRAFYVYESALSDSEVASMLGYLRNKWKADQMTFAHT